MIERKTFPAEGDFSITATTEQMADGSWAVVAQLTHRSPTGEKIIDLPVKDARYSSQAEAESAGVAQARDWIDRNAPHAAA
jgi:hypothetical protein